MSRLLQYAVYTLLSDPQVQGGTARARDAYAERSSLLLAQLGEGTKLMTFLDRLTADCTARWRPCRAALAGSGHRRVRSSGPG